MLGLPKGEVFLTPWTNEWEKEFLLESEQIKSKIGDYIINIYQLKRRKGLKILSKQVNLFYPFFIGETLMYIEARGFY